MNVWSQEVTYMSPDKTHWVTLENIRLAAKQQGIECEPIHHQQFRNMQRFGKRSTRSILRLSHSDQNILSDFVTMLMARL